MAYIGRGLTDTARRNLRTRFAVVRRAFLSACYSYAGPCVRARLCREYVLITTGKHGTRLMNRVDTDDDDGTSTTRFKRLPVVIEYVFPRYRGTRHCFCGNIQKKKKKNDNDNDNYCLCTYTSSPRPTTRGTVCRSSRATEERIQI